MQFMRVNVTFYDAVNAIHDVITTDDPIPYSAKIISCLTVLEIIKLNNSDVER